MVYHAGEWLLPLLAFWLQDWRLLNLAIAAICCITGALLLPFPESPRWLLLKGRQQEMLHALSWLAAVNGRQLPEGLDITHSEDLTAAAAAAAAAAAVDEGLGEGPAAASTDDRAKDAEDTSSSSSSVGQQGAASVDVVCAGACRDGSLAAPLAAGTTSSHNGSDDVLLDSHCTALLSSGYDTVFARQAKQAEQDHHHQQQPPSRQKQQLNTQHSSGLLSLFSHALLARYFVVTALLCTVMAICFYTINLATDSLQVRGMFLETLLLINSCTVLHRRLICMALSMRWQHSAACISCCDTAAASCSRSCCLTRLLLVWLTHLATTAGVALHQLLPHLSW
jgi:hypothetical protein